ncbi:MAG: hypothetical protein WAT79_06980 [Saprospiraceae bacterium]
MKRFETLILMFLVIGFSSQAQNVQERKVSMSLGAQNAFVVDVEGANKKIMEDLFKNAIKDYGRIKENRKAREFYMMSTKVTPINGSSPVDLYVKFDESKGIGSAMVWIDLGGAFANSQEHSNQAKATKAFLQEYYFECRRDVVQSELKEEEKNLDRLEKDYRRLMDKNEGYHKDIENAKQKIAEAEKNIEQNIIDQDNKVIEIDSQKKVVETVTTKLNSIGKN